MPLSSRRPFVGGNSKMNLTRATGTTLARAVSEGVRGVDADIVAFPSLVYLDAVRAEFDAIRSPLGLGAQNCSPFASGAYTGEVSLDQLRDVGATHVLAGHSERRHILGESDELVGQKTAAVLKSGLTCVLCVGETLEEREAGQTDAVNERQTRTALACIDPAWLPRLVIAYEPVWAIGTGRNATPQDAQNAHAAIRALLGTMFSKQAADAIRIIYGGSLKPDNAAALMAQADIDGGLVGGASLVAKDFIAICAAAAARR